MVTSSIMKDMQPNLEVVYRPNAIRALARIIDVSRYMYERGGAILTLQAQSVQSVERFFKSALVDRSSSISSASLVSFRTTCSRCRRRSSSGGRTRAGGC